MGALTGIKAGLAALITVVVAALGGWDAGLELLLVAMSVDIVTGLASAAVKRQLSSAASWKGMTRKAFVLLLIGLSVQLDRAIGTAYIHDAVTWFYIVTELVSILENCAEVGLPVPKVLIETLQKLRKQYGDDTPSKPKPEPEG